MRHTAHGAHLICSAALKPHVAMALAAVQATMLGGRGFTGQQFATLAALILKSGGACRREDAELQLGILASRPPTDPSDFNLDRDIEQRKKGREVLEAMLSANVVRLQPPSSVFPGSSQMARQQLPSNDLRASLLSTQSLSPQPSLYLGYGRAAAEGQGAGTQGFRVAAPSAFELQLWRQQLKQSETRIRASKTEFVMVGCLVGGRVLCHHHHHHHHTACAAKATVLQREQTCKVT
jgi:hypothetical protein